MRPMPLMLRTLLAASLALPLWLPQASAQSGPATLEQLLEQTRTARQRESAEHREREQTFLAERNRQRELLAQARAEQRAEEQRAERLGQAFDRNERRLTELQAELDTKAGTLGEMFGAVRQAAGDTASVLSNSMVSAQFPDRGAFVADLAQRTELPSIESLERLWFEMQREMTESGRVVRFNATLVAADGSESTAPVVRVGPFTAIANGRFLGYLPDSRKLFELRRQPAGRYTSRARSLEQASGGYTAAVIDPTRGSLLATLVQAPDLGEQVRAGGLVGYVIIGLAIIGLAVAGYVFFTLTTVGRRVTAQKKQLDRPATDNPLGRVLKVYHDDPDTDADTLQLRLDEAVLREVPPLERGLSTIKILAAVGPLLGLLGTVTGMILTFRQITLFGTGDPQLMAGGISQALVTTVLGLVMAIPLVLLHSFLNARSKALVQVLEEESAGLIAEYAETHEGAAPHA
jgi:biopolymer transport protein ExbB